MTVQEKAQRKEILKELIRDIHMPSFCDEEGRCDALDECTDTGEYDCSCCNINRVVKAFDRGIEFQKQKSPWISVDEDLPCNHEELIIDEPLYKRTKPIVCNKPHGISVDQMVYDISRNEWYWTGETPTHWFSAPEPPKE